jgi:hypothetical protein
VAILTLAHQTTKNKGMAARLVWAEFDRPSLFRGQRVEIKSASQIPIFIVIPQPVSLSTSSPDIFSRTAGDVEDSDFGN